eukprot:403346482
MQLSHQIAFQSSALSLVLQYLIQTERVKMQQLCQHFYNKTIPQKITPQTTSFLKLDPHYAVPYLGGKRIYRIKFTPSKQQNGKAIFERVYWLPVNQLWDVQVSSQLLKWNYELIKNPQRLKVERVFRVEDAFYLFERNENETTVHKLSLETFEITKIATLKIPYYHGACFGLIQGRYIMQVGGYLYKQTEKSIKSKSYIAKPEYTFDYNLEFQVFDCFSSKFLDSKKFGKMSKGRHGCGLIERKNKVYIVGGVFYSSKQKKINSRDKVEILDFKNPTGQELKETSPFAFTCPDIVGFASCFNDDYVYLTGYSISKKYELPKDHTKPDVYSPQHLIFKLDIKEKEVTNLSLGDDQGVADNILGSQQNEEEKIILKMFGEFYDVKYKNAPKSVTEEADKMKYNVNYQDILIAGRQIIATNDIGHLNVLYQPNCISNREETQKYYYIPANNLVKNLNPILYKKILTAIQTKKPVKKLFDSESKTIEEVKEDKSSQINNLNPTKISKQSNSASKSKVQTNKLNSQNSLIARQSSNANQLIQNQARNVRQQNQNTNHTTNNLITSSQNQQQANINTRNIQSSALVNRRSATAVVNQIQRAQPIATAANPIRTANINIGLVNRSRPQTAVMQARGQSIIQQQSRQ